MLCDSSWTFTAVYHQPELHAALAHEKMPQDFFISWLFPLEGEILMQMSDTQRLLSSDLEVVVSGFPKGWWRWIIK